MMLKCAVVGLGYWGPNIVRNLVEHPQTEVKYVSDLLSGRLDSIKSKYPGVVPMDDYGQILKDPELEAVFIITPDTTHYYLAKLALLAGKHVFVEKPMASTSQKGEELVNLAKSQGLILMVDHPFVFSGAVQKIKELQTTGSLGELLFYDSMRVNLGLSQSNVNVIWDLASHDLSILDFVIAEMPSTVTAVGKEFAGKSPGIAFVTLTYKSGMIAHLNVNRMSPIKLRTILLGGTAKTIVYDDIQPDEKVKVYDKGADIDVKDVEQVRNQLISYRKGDVFSPRIEPVEALKAEIEYFVDAVGKKQISINDGAAGLRIVKILEAAQQSFAANGQHVSL